MNPPPQLSEYVFRWCEPFIVRAVTRWPDETQFDPEEMTNLRGERLSPATFAARMRDAVVSLRKFGWSTNVDTAKLSAMLGTFSITYGLDGSVWWKARGRQGRPSQMVTHPLAATAVGETPRTVWTNYTDDEVRALALLLDKGRLVGPFVLHGVLPDDFVAALQNEFAVAVTVLGEKGQTIVT